MNSLLAVKKQMCCWAEADNEKQAPPEGVFATWSHAGAVKGLGKKCFQASWGSFPGLSAGVAAENRRSLHVPLVWWDTASSCWKAVMRKRNLGSQGTQLLKAPFSSKNTHLPSLFILIVRLL